METNDYCEGVPDEAQEFIDGIAAVHFLRPQRPEPWMSVELFHSWAEAIEAAWEATRDDDRAPAWAAAREASEDAAIYAHREAAYEAAWNAAYNAASGAAERAARNVIPDPDHVIKRAALQAARDAGFDAAARIVADLTDVTALHQRWRAWELGYVPIREEGDKLVVAAKRRARRMRQNEDDR